MKYKYFKLKNYKFWNIDKLMLEQKIMSKLFKFAVDNNLKFLEKFAYDKYVSFSDEIFNKVDIIENKLRNV